MGKFIFGVLVGLCIIPFSVYFYFRSGRAPVATAAPPLPFERYLANMALHATLKREAPVTHTAAASEELLAAGAHVYVQNCVVCHGLPGGPPTAAAKGMYPRPPQLFKAGEMVTDDPAGVTYWKAKHGIRLTGMPGFGDSLTDEQLWEVSLLLARADKISPSVRKALTTSP